MIRDWLIVDEGRMKRGRIFMVETKRRIKKIWFAHLWPIQWERSQDKRLCSRGRTRWSRHCHDASSKACRAPSSRTWASSGRILSRRSDSAQCPPRCSPPRWDPRPRRPSFSSFSLPNISLYLSLSPRSTHALLRYSAHRHVERYITKEARAVWTGWWRSLRKIATCATFRATEKEEEEEEGRRRRGRSEYRAKEREIAKESSRPFRVLWRRRLPLLLRVIQHNQVDELYRGHDRCRWSRELVKLE